MHSRGDEAEPRKRARKGFMWQGVRPIITILSPTRHLSSLNVDMTSAVKCSRNRVPARHGKRTEPVNATIDHAHIRGEPAFPLGGQPRSAEAMMSAHRARWGRRGKL